MKTGQLITTTTTGTRSDTGDVVLVVSKVEARVLFDALDLYCTANPQTRVGKELYHAFGWNYAQYLPKDGKDGGQ